ncbi:MAG: hypothetical protein ACYCYN_04300, partial [Solirubrobacteraceae bacterium]
SRREAPPRPARSRDGALERGGRVSGETEPIVAPDLLLDDSLLAREELVGQTVEADVLRDSAEQSSTRPPATDAGSRREAARRSSRPRPEA